MTRVLDIRRLWVRYPGTDPAAPDQAAPDQAALDQVGFHVDPKEIFGIIGESGAGKTTICHSLMGCLPPGTQCRGYLGFRGKNLAALDPGSVSRLYTRRIALVPQGTGSLNPLVTIGSHLIETLKVAWPGAGPGEIRERALNLLGRFGLPPLPKTLGRYPFQLSGGMNQRVLLCLAFAGTPDLVVCDEPTKALDPGLKSRIISVMARVPQQQDTAIVMVTHDLETARQLCGRLAVLHRGRMVETGPAVTLLDHPGHPYTRALVRAMPENGLHPMARPDWTRRLARGTCGFAPWCTRAGACEGRPAHPALPRPGQKVWCSRA